MATNGSEKKNWKFLGGGGLPNTLWNGNSVEVEGFNPLTPEDFYILE